MYIKVLFVLLTRDRDYDGYDKISLGLWEGCGTEKVPIRKHCKDLTPLLHKLKNVTCVF